jgi:hypothetical protein
MHEARDDRQWRKNRRRTGRRVANPKARDATKTGLVSRTIQPSRAVGFIGPSPLSLLCPPAHRTTCARLAAAMAAAAARSFLRSSAPSSVRATAARAAASRVGPAPLPRRLPTSAPRVLLRYARSHFHLVVPDEGMSYTSHFNICNRSPVEMSSVCLESLMPMHSATASALMTSLLAAPASKGFGWLSEGDFPLPHLHCPFRNGR